jgi:L-asparaginase/Glu-tRNA(Gln) amidotransferase subunit D
LNPIINPITINITTRITRPISNAFLNFDQSVVADAVFDNNVALVKFHPGQDPAILDFYRKKGYKGIIIEMTGLGHVCSEGIYNWIPKFQEVIKKDLSIKDFIIPIETITKQKDIVFNVTFTHHEN